MHIGSYESSPLNNDCYFHSYLKLSTGLARAAFRTRKRIVPMARAMDISPAKRKYCIPILIRYGKFCKTFFMMTMTTGQAITLARATRIVYPYMIRTITFPIPAPSTLRIPISLNRRLIILAVNPNIPRQAMMIASMDTYRIIALHCFCD